MTTAVLNDLILTAIDRAALLGIEAIALLTLASFPLLLIAYYPRWKRQQQPQPEPTAAPEMTTEPQPPTPDLQPLTPIEVMPAPTARRRRHEALIQQAKELHERAIASDAALLAVATLATQPRPPRRRRSG